MYVQDHLSPHETVGFEDQARKGFPLPFERLVILTFPTARSHEEANMHIRLARSMGSIFLRLHPDHLLLPSRLSSQSPPTWNPRCRFRTKSSNILEGSSLHPPSTPENQGAATSLLRGLPEIPVICSRGCRRGDTTRRQFGVAIFRGSSACLALRTRSHCLPFAQQ